MESINGNFLRGHLENMVLSVLERAEAHGFEILRRLEKEGQGALKLKEGTLYPALYRLEQSGCVKAKWEDNTTKRRGPRRRIYTITAKGRKQLAAGRENWDSFVSIVSQILESRG